MYDSYPWCQSSAILTPSIAGIAMVGNLQQSELVCGSV